jgi:hypothetical protein
VVLTFEGNSSYKIGVRFDQSIPEGNDLGGRCEEDHGFFCTGVFLNHLDSVTDLLDDGVCLQQNIIQYH